MGSSEAKQRSSRYQQSRLKERVSRIDPETEALLLSLRMENPNLTCTYSNKKISKLCLNPKCRISLRCSDLSCKNCGKETHPLCSSVSFLEFTDLLNNHVENCKEFMTQIFKEEEALIDSIRKSQKDFINRFTSIAFERNIYRIVTEIYQRKNTEALNGREAVEVCAWLQDQVVSSMKQSKNLLNRYSRQVDRIVAEVNGLTQQTLKNFLDDKGTIASTAPTQEEKDIIDTKILQLETHEGSGQLEFLMKSLSYPKSLKLLFRASEHNFSAQAFHKKCDGINDTLVIVRTQFGKTIAGYTHYKWDQVKNNFVHDMKKRAFLLQLDKRFKMVPQRENRLINCNRQLGPSFGFNDLTLVDKCDLNAASMADFPCTFNREGSPYKPDAQESWFAFSGAKKGYRFRVEQYEVFQVEFN